MNRRTWLASVLAAATGASLRAGPPVLLGKSEDELAGLLRGLLLQNLPNPLYEKKDEWDKQRGFDVLRIRRGKPVMESKLKNDGLWKRVRVDALNPRESLILDLRDVSQPTLTSVKFTLFVACDVRIDAAQEQWESGIRLYGVSVRARTKVRATIQCEATVRTEMVAGILEFVVALKVPKCDVGYENLVVEHVAGLGGEAAKALGGAGLNLIHQWKPSLERKLLEKANHALTRAAEKKEVRLSLKKLLKQPG
ncbi:MAG: hypothetical protein K1X57_07750 [Gemmataceae bacterium]|nr:hypothetical protein [Gemmataceae bacterium]